VWRLWPEGRTSWSLRSLQSICLAKLSKAEANNRSWSFATMIIDIIVKGVPSYVYFIPSQVVVA
jgi:hypothetical protein